MATGGFTRGDIPEGAFTATIYGLIRDSDYTEAIRLLNVQLSNFPKSRAALSLLGYCHYHMQDFPNASSTYETLSKYYPEVEEYKIYHAQSRFIPRSPLSLQNSCLYAITSY